MKKLDWIQFYIGLAFAVSKKSPDAETQHGCIITNRKNQPLGFGYNGFPRGVDDDAIPDTRPEKYPWAYHSEENAVANCIHKPENGIAYVTGHCCNHCIYTLWQHGVTTVYMADRHGSHDKKVMDKKWFDEFVEKTGIEIHYVTPNLSWLHHLGSYVISPTFYKYKNEPIAIVPQKQIDAAQKLMKKIKNQQGTCDTCDTRKPAKINFWKSLKTFFHQR